MVPFQNIDRKGFKEIFKTLKSRYALPARTPFIQIEMPKLYGKVLEQVEKKIHTIKHFCFSEMEVTWEKILYFFYAVLRPNQYFTPSEAFISKLEDTINILWYNTVTFYASNHTVIYILVHTVQPKFEGTIC